MTAILNQVGGAFDMTLYEDIKEVPITNIVNPMWQTTAHVYMQHIGTRDQATDFLINVTQPSQKNQKHKYIHELAINLKWEYIKFNIMPLYAR